MPFSITAELPLGTYRGAVADGQVDPMPSVLRLHSALLAAAGFGPRAQARDGGLAVSDADAAALRWLESNPPDEVSIPALQVNRGTAIAYRDDGTVKASKGVLSVKKLQKSPDAGVAVAGRFVWSWSTPPPPEVAAALELLCPDVPYLGTTESPVRLRTTVEEPEPTHSLDEQAGLFTAGGQDIDVPLPGRVDELLTAHEANTSKTPPLRQDAYGSDERSSSPVPPRSASAVARYVSLAAQDVGAPWPQVLVLPLDRPVAEREQVAWAVAAHRALIATIGDGAPPVVTGVYPPGMPRPANRLALHMLGPEPGSALPAGAAVGLAVMLPAGIGSGDVQVILAALGNLTSVRGPRGQLRRVTGRAVSVSGAQFWPERPVGTVRVWRTSPLAVPDTRGGDAGWTFAHAALLSLGFVWHASGRLPTVEGRGQARDRRIVEAVNEAGAAVLTTRPLRTTAVHEYVHRVNPHAVVRPYRAWLWLGDLGGDRVVQAIGQSRHLGGGLLVPVDVPEGSNLNDLIDTGAEVTR